jgi:hypothetical protein
VRSVRALQCIATVIFASATALLAFAAPVSATTTYTPNTPAVDSVTGGPWNTSQGDSSAGSAYQQEDLFPTYTPGGSMTSLGGLELPNLAVFPAAEATKVPYPSGVAGTPGPLDGYCSSLGANPETGTPVPQPGRPLPMAPYYFPDVVRNADGSLTGYFDYRPKDAEEAVTVAKSTDDGASWTTEGDALGENSGYCPSADANDDGQGHPYAMSMGPNTDLYTLQRPAGDNTGIGLLVHPIHPAATDPLEGLPEDQSVGVDPNTFATAEARVPDSAEGGSAAIPVSTLGEAGSPEHIVAGPYEDYNAASPSSTIVTCTGVNASPAELTGCTVSGSSSLTVKASNDLVQVIAKAEKAVTVPAGPNKPNGEAGLESLKFTNGNTAVSPLTTYVMNLNAPNRVYVQGQAVYCSQANSNPTTKLEFCTSAKALSVETGAAITADPILPPETQMTSGLIAPDGIVGTLPSYPGAPEGSTVVLYTEKILSYFIEGTVNGFIEGTKFEKKTIKLPKATINYTPSVTESEQKLPESGSFKIYLGTAVGQPIQELNCTGNVAATQSGVPTGSRNLTGCTGGTGEVKEGNWVGGPNAAIAPYSALEQIGEGNNGSSKGPQKLFGDNEDYTVLRAAYTTNGVEFHDLGAISGSTSGAGNDNGTYNDISNPDQQSSPKSSAEPTVATPTPSSPTNLAQGSADQIELRYVGSRGTIVTNPNGTYGMFLSGSWASDGDSDAFNQIFYSESSNGTEWSVPKVVLSSEYEFKASREQDQALASHIDAPLGISAYYSGRAYGPAVVQNPNGSLTMVFAGYRLPKPVTGAGTKLGTNASAQYTVSEKGPTLYRNILTMHLTSSTSPGVTTSTTVSASDKGSGAIGAPVTYTATVAPSSPGTGTPTSKVAFADSHGAIAGCSEVGLNEGSPDTATCTTTHESPAGSDEVTATYTGDSNYAGSSGKTTESVQEAPAITSGESTTFTEGAEGNFEVTATGTPAPTISESGTLPEGVGFDAATGKLSGTPTQEGVFLIEFTAANGVGSNVVQHFTLTVDAPPTITSADEETFAEGAEGSFPVTATGTPTPTITESGPLPEGVKFNAAIATLEGTPTQTGVFPIEFTAANGIGANAVQHFTLTVNASPEITSEEATTFTEGSFGSFSVTASGFPDPAIFESGTLPEGVSFEPFSGTLSGVPSQQGVFHLEFTAANGVSPNAVQHFTLTVDAPPAIDSSSEATFNDHAHGEFEVTATGTPAPRITKWGSLPEGVTYTEGTGALAGTGVLSGTPTQTGTFQITFTAENGVGSDSVQQFTLKVLGLHITTSSLPEVTPGKAYSEQLEAIGGVAPYKWKLVNSKLPKGLKLSHTGLLSGTVSARRYPHGGTFPITVKATDSTKKTHQTATTSFNLTVS